MPDSTIDLTELAPMLNELTFQGRTALLPTLHAVQEQYGYIPAEAVAEIARILGISPQEVRETVEFYPMFYSEPVAKTVVHVCNNPVCANAGAEAVMKRLSQTLEVHRMAGEPVGTLTLEYAPCLGLCEHAPAMIIQGTSVARADSVSYEDLVSGKLRHPRSIVRNEIAILTANCGKNRVNWITLYQASGGYKALRKAVQMSPQAVIDEVKASGLLGRGGAAYPTGLKWESAAGEPGHPKYIVCNADEAEPGTFKDRVLLEDEPHLVLEGLIIAAYATGAEKGFIYVRGEYIFQYKAMLRAVDEARQANYLGEHILGTSFNFDVEVRRGAGTYVAGEETAQLESIEGKVAIPRTRPPFPTSKGLFGQPTIINNVETLANVPYIIRAGAAEYRKIGTPGSTGPKLFCLSGDVTMPGVYEVPFGVTFRHLLEDLAGGVRGGRKMKAALFGGAAGAFATPDQLDIALTVEDLRANGLPLGSGVITVFDETRDLKDVCLRLGRFFAEESCGKCAACKTGTMRQYDILQRMIAGKMEPGDLEQLNDTAWTDPTESICGVGQMAATPILSAMKHWPEIFR
ncbi:MAG TPA: NAD(P)H-dependent oxidoreductase subunit E [Anaerolinea sp.]|nr:NAD(P)H-dependent oxidoreductase subunit E [Anaerolinea sp.]